MFKLRLVPILLLIAAPALAGPNRDDIALGEQVQGQPVSKADLQRSVVVVVCWTADERRGAIQAAPVMEHLQTQECEELQVLLQLEGEPTGAQLPFPLFKGLTVSGRRASITAAWVFRQDGTQAFRGNPRTPAFFQAITKALAAAQPVLDAGLETKRVRKVATRATKAKTFTKTLKTLDRIEAKGSAEERAEAAMVRERIVRQGRRALESADASRPAKTVGALEDLKKRFSGHPLAMEAKQKLRELLKDHTFKKELAADLLLNKLKLVIAECKPCTTCSGGGGLSFGEEDDDVASPFLACTGCRQVNRRAVPTLVRGFKALSKRYAGTKASKRAEKIWRDLAPKAKAGIGFN